MRGCPADHLRGSRRGEPRGLLRAGPDRADPGAVVPTGTPPNPANAFPGLTLLELLERSAGHESSHARQIDLNRQFVLAFRSQERDLNIAALGDGDPSRLSTEVRDMLNMADYVVGEVAAVGHLVRGVRLTMHDGNREELVNRADQESREGLWAVICVMSDGGDDEETVAIAHRFAETVVVHRAAG